MRPDGRVKLGARAGLAILLLAALIWGLGNAATGLSAMKYRSHNSLLPGIDISLVNTLGGLAFLLAISGTFRNTVKSSVPSRIGLFPRNALAAGILKGANTCLFVFSTTQITASEALVFESTYILWSVALAVLILRKHIALGPTIFHVLLLISGVLLMSDLGLVSMTPSAAGTFFGLAAGLTYAAFLSFWSRVTDELEGFQSQLYWTTRLLAVSGITIVLVTQIASLIWQHRLWIPFRAIAPVDLLIQFINGCLVVGAVYLLVTLGMTRVRIATGGSSVVAAFCMSFSIPFTVIPEIIVGKFVLSTYRAVGIVMFMSGFALLNASLSRRSK